MMIDRYLKMFGAAGLVLGGAACKRASSGESRRSDAPVADEAGQGGSDAPGSGSTDDFVAGGAPASITGVNLAELDVDNARIRCDFVSVDADLHHILCRAAAITPNGGEVLATSIAAGVEVTWPAPQLVAGQAEVVSCDVAPNRLSQECDVKLKDTTAKISLSLSVHVPATGKTRVEKAVVFLPYSVGIAAGFVAEIPYLYLTGTEDSLALANAAPKLTGMQPITVKPDHYQLLAIGMCVNKGRIFFTNGSMIRVLENGQVSHYAGSPDDDSYEDYSDRRRITLAPDRVVCDDGAIYVTQYSGKVLKLNEAGPVEVVSDGLVSPRRLTRGPAGDFYVSDGKGPVSRISRFVLGKPAEPLIEASTGKGLYEFAVNADGDVLYEERTTKPVIRSFKVRAAGGVTTDVVRTIDWKTCANDCGFFSLIAIGKSFFALGPSKAPGTATIYELSDAKPPRIVRTVALKPTHLFTDGKDFLLSDDAQVVRVAINGTTTAIAGRDAENQLAADGPATEAQFVPAIIALSPNGQTLIADDKSFQAFRIIDKEGTIRTPSDLRDRDETSAPTFASDGSLLFIDTEKLYSRSETGEYRELGAMASVLAGYEFGTESVVGLVAHGDDLYAFSSKLITRRHAGGDPSVVVGLLTANTGATAINLGEGSPAATHGRLENVVALAVGNDGSVYYVDQNPSRLRRVDRDGILTTIATDDDTNYSDLVGVAVANDGSVYAADSAGTIDLFVPQVAGSATPYKVEPLVHNRPGARKDCGTGRVRKKAAAEDIDGAIRASLSVMCIGTILSLAIDDTCPAEGGHTRIMIGQGFYDFGNLLEIIRPCRKPVAP